MISYRRVNCAVGMFLKTSSKMCQRRAHGSYSNAAKTLQEGTHLNDPEGAFQLWFARAFFKLSFAAFGIPGLARMLLSVGNSNSD